MKLHDLVKLFGELVFLITSIALAHILIVKVLMHGGEVGWALPSQLLLVLLLQNSLANNKP